MIPISELSKQIEYVYYNPSIFEGDDIEVLFKNNTWKVTQSKSTVVFDTVLDVVDYMHNNNFSTDGLYDEIYTAVLNQGFYHQTRLEAITELVGTKALENITEQWDGFFGQMKNVLNPKPKLEIVE